MAANKTELRFMVLGFIYNQNIIRGRRPLLQGEIFGMRGLEAVYAIHGLPR